MRHPRTAAPTARSGAQGYFTNLGTAARSRVRFAYPRYKPNQRIFMACRNEPHQRIFMARRNEVYQRIFMACRNELHQRIFMARRNKPHQRIFRSAA